MKCIFCGKENVNEEYTIYNENILTCNDCKGKYSIFNNKKILIKIPKWNINPFIPFISFLLIIPISLIDRILPEIRNEYILKTLQFIFFIYVNFTTLSMAIVGIKNIYNYITNRYMLFIGEMITREDDSLFVRRMGIIRSLTVGIGGLILTISIDLYLLG
jgi:hypothetical protein